jgi:hypothetical protein
LSRSGQQVGSPVGGTTDGVSEGGSGTYGPVGSGGRGITGGRVDGVGDAEGLGGCVGSADVRDG